MKKKVRYFRIIASEYPITIGTVLARIGRIHYFFFEESYLYSGKDYLEMDDSFTTTLYGILVAKTLPGEVIATLKKKEFSYLLNSYPVSDDFLGDVAMNMEMKEIPEEEFFVEVVKLRLRKTK